MLKVLKKCQHLTHTPTIFLLQLCSYHSFWHQTGNLTMEVRKFLLYSSKSKTASGNIVSLVILDVTDFKKRSFKMIWSIMRISISLQCSPFYFWLAYTFPYMTSLKFSSDFFHLPLQLHAVLLYTQVYEALNYIQVNHWQLWKIILPLFLISVGFCEVTLILPGDKVQDIDTTVWWDSFY